MKEIKYKIEKDVPLVRAHRFDVDLPEYVTMMKLKVGDSFEFPSRRYAFVRNSRVYIQKNHEGLTFVMTTESTIKKHKLKTGRVWRVKDGSTRKFGTRKKRLKPGKGLILKPNE